MVFASENLLSEHLRAGSLCSIRDAHFDGFDRDQEKRLRASRRHSQEPTGEAGMWKLYYTILFPEVSESAVPSPFAEPTSAHNETPRAPSGPGNSRPGSMSSIPVDFEKTADDQYQDPSRARSNTQTSLHPSSAEVRRGHASRDSRSEEMSRYALTPLQTDVHRSTSEWVQNLSPASLSSETPLSGSGILQPNRSPAPKYALPSDSGISGADSRSPNDGMSETSEDLEIHRLQQEVDGARKEAGTYQSLLLHHQKAWDEEKLLFQKRLRELEAVVNSLRIENKSGPIESGSPVQDGVRKPEQDNLDQRRVQEPERSVPQLKVEEGMLGIGLQVTQSPTQFGDGQVQDLNQHLVHDQPMLDFRGDEDSSQSESESELAGEESWLNEIVRHHRKRAFQELLQTAALDSSGSQDGPRRPPGNSGGAQGGNGSSGNGRPGNSKRGREGGDDGADSNGRDDKGKKDNNVPEAKRSKPNNVPRLACIFYQRAPHEHLRGACTGPGFPSITRLR